MTADLLTSQQTQETLSLLARSHDVRLQAIGRAARPDFEDWLSHVRPAAACARPIRLAGTMERIEAETGRLLSREFTRDLPDGVIYKACGNRRAIVCPACSARYKRDAYQIIRAGLVGGRGVPEDVSAHPAVFPTFTAPSFGEVHTRHVKRHTCGGRHRCDCRPDPCHARRELVLCPHGRRLVCFARHEVTDAILGTPLCLDCYEYDGQAVWNAFAGQLWARTTTTIRKFLRRRARDRGIDFPMVQTADGTFREVDPFRLSFGKAAEMQRRAVVHFHAIIRLDGVDPDDPAAIVPSPPEFTARDLVDAVAHAAYVTGVRTPPHPARHSGWPIRWGEQLKTKIVTVGADGQVTDEQVSNYLAKYATKATEDAGFSAGRLTATSIDLYADPDGDHVARLLDACWRLGISRWPAPVQGPRCPGPCEHRTCARAFTPPLPAQPVSGPVCDTGCGHLSCRLIRNTRQDPAAVFARLRRWAHMLGFGGHFLTKSRRYSFTFAIQRERRIVFRRTETSGPATDRPDDTPTVLVVNFLQFVGAGWHTTADAMLANTSAALAREHHEAALADLAALAA
ncbi:replication initiator [Dactylosporangium sp. NPDC051541]|uniref:replication initiator n=1 Tax=Dactylosporangium sp. NPDC051541 TaxID=3363977 RepID=UPI00378D5FCB